MLVERRRSAGPADVSDSYPITLISDLKIGHMKHRERDISKISQPRIKEGYACVRRRRLQAVRSEAGRYKQRRVTAAVSAAIQMHRIGQVPSPRFAVVAENVAPVERIDCRQSGRFESVAAGNSARSAKNSGQAFV